MSDTKLFDVVIANAETRKIEAVIGRAMPERSADRREETGLLRIGPGYFVSVLPHDAGRTRGDTV